MTHRVLFVSTPPYIGGAEVSLMALMQNLNRNQYQPQLLTSAKGALFEQACELGIPVSAQSFPWFSRRRPWHYLGSIYHLSKIIRREGIKLIHTNCDHSLRYVMYASKLTGVPFVSHVRDLVRTWFEPEKVSALNQAQQVIANSNATAEACVRAGINQTRLKTIYNPINVNEFAQIEKSTAVEWRAGQNIPANNLVVGIVGQIQPIKGHQEFIEASCQLAATLSNISFVVVGAPPPGETNSAFAAQLQASVSSLGHAERFHFLGFQNNISVIMNALDILVVPSWQEPFGRVAVEGMAAGCTVIGTRAGGLPEIITDDVDGLLVSPKNVPDLLAALHRVAIDQTLRCRLAQAGQRTAQKFAVANHVNSIQTVYDSILVNYPH
ncbi:MAG: glycosyltransferase family 4 protein [Anaerolineae bacterium]|nr:glycosyltransferase family 4 protein [Anaerolineae bacterium]